jgi:hypothetical protein
MTKTVIKKIKIIKKNDISKKVINQVSDMMETCSISETNQKQIDILQNKVNELESEIMIKREQLRNVVLCLNGEGDCICRNKTSKVGDMIKVDVSLLDEEPLPDEDGEYQNYFQNVMCVPCLVDYYYKRLNKLKQSTKKSNK